MSRKYTIMNTFVGRINKLFGTEGGLMLSLYGGFPEDFDPATTPLFVAINSLDVPLWCDRFERRGVSSAVVNFADFDTERRAEELIGREFFIDAEDETGDDDEFYMEDLIGFAIRGTECDAEGTHSPFEATLTDFYDNEINPLFELEVRNRRVLIPATEEFIAGIDFEHRTMKLVLPAGLLDLE